MKLELAKIRLDGGTQTRASRCKSTVKEYAEAMREGVTFPPVVVFHDGEAYWLADGFHRVDAASLAGKQAIQADVRQGTRREAILHSVGANAAHGLRRTNADKRRAVTMLLGDEEWAARSDRWIAAQCGVSDRFVNKIRDEVRTVRSSASNEKQEPAKTMGKDGKARSKPFNSRKPTPALPPEPPEPQGPAQPKLKLVEDVKPVVEDPPAEEFEDEDEYDEEESEIVKASRLVFEVEDYLRAVVSDFPPSQLDQLWATVAHWAIRVEEMRNGRQAKND